MNEVVIDRGPDSHLCSLECYCDGLLITTIQADGYACTLTLSRTVRIRRALIDLCIVWRSSGSSFRRPPARPLTRSRRAVPCVTPSCPRFASRPSALTRFRAGPSCSPTRSPSEYRFVCARLCLCPNATDSELSRSLCVTAVCRCPRMRAHEDGCRSTAAHAPNSTRANTWSSKSLDGPSHVRLHTARARIARAHTHARTRDDRRHTANCARAPAQV
jgi:hypothetical protein